MEGMTMSVKFSDSLVKALKGERQKLAALAGVVGVDRGYRYRGGKRLDEVCLRVFLDGPKVPQSQLGLGKNVATLLGRPAADVDVIDLTNLDFPRQGLPPRLASPLALERLNPIQPGISVSHLGQGSGTLGLIVYRNATGERAVLSCAHVIAGQFARRNDPIFQPGVLDGGEPDFDGIGYLEDWFVDEDGDAAIAVLNRSRMVALEQLSTEREVAAAGPVELGDLVEKSGRGSGLTQGLVDGIGLYQMNLAGFSQMWISGFRLVPRGSASGVVSSAGDSGAVWYRSNGIVQGVGLHIDGEPARVNGQGHPEYAIACHLPKVLERLDVALAPATKARSWKGETAAASSEPYHDGEVDPALDDWPPQPAAVVNAGRGCGAGGEANA
jgi:endonuclease G, mitochondrial